MTIQELLTRFESVKKSGNGYQCRCPAHDDKKASLSITEKGGKLLFCCHAGCTAESVLAGVGLTFADLGDKRKYKWRERLEYAQGKKIEAVYPYYDERGRYLYSKIRFEGKEIRYAVVDEAADSYSYGKGGHDGTLYRLPQMLKAVENGQTVYIVEGEKDADTLTKLGLTAATAGGVKDWRREYRRFFLGARVVILPDNDDAGRDLCERIKADLKQYAYCITWVQTSQAEKGDVTDYMNEGHTKDDLLKLISGAKEKNTVYAPWLSIDNKGKKSVNVDILADTFESITDYIQVSRSGEDKEDIYLYRHGVYKLCSISRLESEIKRLLPSGIATPETVTRARKLLMMNDAHMVDADKLNADETYINFRNGLYNIKTRKLEPHTPNAFYTVQLKCNYEPTQTTVNTFAKYIKDLCSGADGTTDKSKIQLLQEWTGLLLSNIPVYKVKQCLVLYSPIGNTGKSQYTSLLSSFFDDGFISAVPLDKLSERFAVSFLQSKRLNIVGDQQNTDILASNVFKELTGGDMVFCEPKGRQAYSFRYRGGLVFGCNDLPCFTDDKGGHMFERLCIIPCEHVVPENERQNNLLELMQKEKPAIMNWAVIGLHRLIDNGFRFTECEASKRVMEEYRRSSDTVYDYIAERYEMTGNISDRVKRADFEIGYTAWCVENERTPLRKRNIKERMAKLGIVCVKVHGLFCYRGLKPKENLEPFEPENPPFG